MATEQNKAISISKFDVDPEGEYLQLMVDCPADIMAPDGETVVVPGYHFTTMTITVYNKNYRDQKGHQITYNFSDAVFGEQSEKETHWAIKIPLTFNMENGEVIPSMYKLYIAAEKNIISTDNDTSDLLSTIAAITEDDEDQIEPAVAWTSDLRHVYDCMAASILNSDPCEGLPDSVIRNEVLLQGHLLALKNQKTMEALEYFILLNNCGSNCGQTHTHFAPCNCNSK